MQKARTFFGVTFHCTQLSQLYSQSKTRSLSKNPVFKKRLFPTFSRIGKLFGHLLVATLYNRELSQCSCTATNWQPKDIPIHFLQFKIMPLTSLILSPLSLFSFVPATYFSDSFFLYFLLSSCTNASCSSFSHSRFFSMFYLSFQA